MFVNMFGGRNIDSILKTFDRVAYDLETHLGEKVNALFSLKSLHTEVEGKIEATSAEIERADRVLAKVKDLIV